MANVLFTTVGTAGDVLPIIRIGSRLKARGHDVTLLTHCAFGSLAEEAGLNFYPLDNADEFEASIDDGPLLNTPRGVPQYLRRHYFPRVAAECGLIRQHHHPARTVVVARDLFDMGARITSEKLGIPLRWIFVAPSQLLNWQLRAELFGRILAEDVNRLRQEQGLAAVTDWRKWLSYPGRHPGIWPDWFAAPDPSWPAEVVPVGFVRDNDDEREAVPDEIGEMLDSGEPPILITGGTGTFTGAAFYHAGTEACRLAGRRGILVTPHNELVPAELPPSVRRYRHLPLGKIMPRMGAVVHHGGRGTMACALASGTPQVVLAWGADRPGNATRLAQLGVAEYLPLPAWKPELVAAALQRLTTSTAVRKCCHDLADRISATDSLTNACQVIEQAIETSK